MNVVAGEVEPEPVEPEPVEPELEPAAVWPEKENEAVSQVPPAVQSTNVIFDLDVLRI